MAGLQEKLGVKFVAGFGVLAALAMARASGRLLSACRKKLCVRCVAGFGVLTAARDGSGEWRAVGGVDSGSGSAALVKDQHIRYASDAP